MLQDFAGELVCIVLEVQLPAIHQNAVARVELVQGKRLAEAPLQEGAPCLDIKLRGQVFRFTAPEGCKLPRPAGEGAHHLHLLRVRVEEQLIVPHHVRGRVQPLGSKRIPQRLCGTLQVGPGHSGSQRAREPTQVSRDTYHDWQGSSRQSRISQRTKVSHAGTARARDNP